MAKKPAAAASPASEWDDEPATTATQDQAAAAEPETEAAAPAPGTVRVRCISDRFPWTDKKALAEGEVADVPAAVAKALRDKKFVELA